MKKVKNKLDDMERRILVKLLYEKRKELIRAGCHADAIDEPILKIIDPLNERTSFGFLKIQNLLAI